MRAHKLRPFVPSGADYNAWWKHIQSTDIVDKYKIRTNPPQIQPYGKVLS